MLDVHRTLLDARTARRARPQDVGLDHVGDQAGRCGALTRTVAAAVAIAVPARAEERARPAEQIVPEVHDDELR